MKDKKDNYVEVDLSTFGMDIEVLTDFLARAKASGLTEVEASVAICPYYGGVDGVTLRASKPRTFNETK